MNASNQPKSSNPLDISLLDEFWDLPSDSTPRQLTPNAAEPSDDQPSVPITPKTPRKRKYKMEDLDDKDKELLL